MPSLIYLSSRDSFDDAWDSAVASQNRFPIIAIPFIVISTIIFLTGISYGIWVFRRQRMIINRVVVPNIRDQPPRWGPYDYDQRRRGRYYKPGSGPFDGGMEVPPPVYDGQGGHGYEAGDGGIYAVRGGSYGGYGGGGMDNGASGGITSGGMSSDAGVSRDKSVTAQG